MGGSSEKSKDIAWNSKMKPMILKKRNFTLGKVKTMKFVKETCNSEICEFFSNKYQKILKLC
jgi:hypothetical protein